MQCVSRWKLSTATWNSKKYLPVFHNYNYCNLSPTELNRLAWHYPGTCTGLFGIRTEFLNVLCTSASSSTRQESVVMLKSPPNCMKDEHHSPTTICYLHCTFTGDHSTRFQQTELRTLTSKKSLQFLTSSHYSLLKDLPSRIALQVLKTERIHAHKQASSTLAKGAKTLQSTTESALAFLSFKRTHLRTPGWKHLKDCTELLLRHLLNKGEKILKRRFKIVATFQFEPSNGHRLYESLFLSRNVARLLPTSESTGHSTQSVPRPWEETNRSEREFEQKD